MMVFRILKILQIPFWKIGQKFWCRVVLRLDFSRYVVVSVGKDKKDNVLVDVIRRRAFNFPPRLKLVDIPPSLDLYPGVYIFRLRGNQCQSREGGGAVASAE